MGIVWTFPQFVLLGTCSVRTTPALMAWRMNDGRTPIGRTHDASRSRKWNIDTWRAYGLRLFDDSSLHELDSSFTPPEEARHLRKPDTPPAVRLREESGSISK